MVTVRSRLIFVFLLMLIFCHAGASRAAAIKVYVDQDQLRVDQSFQLYFEATESVDDDPDFTPLEQNFDILGRNHSSSTSFVNGSFSSKKTWILTLMPKRAGVLKVPPISFGSDRSSALALTIEQADTTAGPRQNKDLYLKVEVEPKSVYLQQQFSYKVRLFRRVEITNASLTEPEINGVEAIVEKRDQDRNFETIIDGRRYLVIERSYNIYPQQSGRLRIEPIVFSGQVVQSQRSFFDPLGQAGPVRRLSSDAFEIDIKPIPKNFSGKHWLPAENLQVVENWSTDPQQLTVGEPATRTLLLSADGVLASQLPQLSTDKLPDFKLYPDQPKLETDSATTPSHARRTEKVAFIPKHPGSFQLPAIRVDWWNTQTDRPETFVLPARTVSVVAAPAAIPATPQAPVSPDEPATAETAPQQPSTAPASPLSTAEPTSLFWPLTSAFLAGGWLLSAFFWWRSSRSTPRRQNQGTDSKAKQTKKPVQQACRDNDPQAAATALLDWGKRNWPQQPPTNLTEIGNRCGGEVAEQIQLLSAALYSAKQLTWSGEKLWQAFKGISAEKVSVGDSKKEALKNLYPE